MLVVLLIFVIALTPSLISAWLVRRSNQQMQDRFWLIMDTAAHRGLQGFQDQNPELRYREGIGFAIGDVSCEFNARSPHIRCAVNPMGPCEECRFYQTRELPAIYRRGTSPH